MKTCLLCIGATLFVSLFTLLGCKQPSNNNTYQNDAAQKNLTSFPQLWSASTDTFGSRFLIQDNLVSDEIVSVEFSIVQKLHSHSWYPYVELICKLPYVLSDSNTITISYKCSRGLIVKLSQSDFGENGIASYAHYQFSLPPSIEFTQASLYPQQFQQPVWADSISKKIALNLSNVDAIYLVPDLNYETGDHATLIVSKLIIN